MKLNQASTREDILIVDDNPANLRLLAETLIGEGYAVRAAPNGRLAIEATRARAPDLILLDIRMPDMNGFEVCAILKQTPASQDIPIIFLSALHETTDKLKGFEAGGVDYITKPFAPEEVLVRVRTHLDLRALRRNLEKRVVERTEQLARSEQRFRAIFEQAAVGIAEVGLDGRWLMANQRLCDILGYGREELAALSFQDATHPDDLEAGLALVRRTLDGELDSYSQEKRYLRKDGATVWVNLTVALVRDADGTPAYFISVVEDVSPQKEAEQKLRRTVDALTRSNADLERFAYAASHDLKEPLRSIVMFSQLLARKYGDQLDRDGAEFIRYLVDGAKHMVELVQGLLDFSRVDSQGQRFTLLQMGRAAAAAIDTLGQALAESGAEVSLGPMPEVMADEVQIVHLFQNLIGNAIKFRRLDQPSQIRVDCQRRGTEWEFTVSDNGIGLEPAYADQVFVIFKRLHTQEAYPGSGIGLALCKRIVERHGGRIWVESDGVGHGCTFRFTLPATAATTSSCDDAIRAG